MATGQLKSNTDRRKLLMGVVVLLLVLSLLGTILTVSMRQPKPLVQQEPISAPPPVQEPVPTPVPAPIVAAPIVVKPKKETPKPEEATTPAPQKQVAAKPEPAKPAAVVALSAPEKPKPEAKKVAPPPKVEKKAAPKPLQTGYRKLGRDGTILPDDATKWVCVQDLATGLIWEVKTDDNSIRDRDNFYTWFNPTNERNDGNAGARDGGRCKGDADCDTLAYIQAINVQRLCGFADWRLPVKDELLSLVEYNYGSKKTRATINREYFPHTVPSWYWTASSNPKKPDYAWYVLFRNGVALNALKEQPKHVRLVRGGKRGNEQSGQSHLKNLVYVLPRI